MEQTILEEENKTEKQKSPALITSYKFIRPLPQSSLFSFCI